MLHCTPHWRSIRGSVRAGRDFGFNFGGMRTRISERGEDGLGAADRDLGGVGLDLHDVLVWTGRGRRERDIRRRR